MIGQIIEKYEILEKLQEGGMGSVYLAEQVSLGRHVAVKILSPRLLEEAQFVERFERLEAEVEARLYGEHVGNPRSRCRED